MNRVFLKFCSANAVRCFEQAHYVRKMQSYAEHRGSLSKDIGEVRGHHGQQIHYLIWYEVAPDRWQNVGAISGGSAVYTTKVRDVFFMITKDNREKALPGIIDNTLFRIEGNHRNLATKVLSVWRRQIEIDWRELYQVTPYGFETFVEEADIIRQDGSIGQRRGALYRADNWTFVGKTEGSTKHHIGRGLDGGLKDKPFLRERVLPKLVFCKWNKGFSKPELYEYKSSWRKTTDAEKQLTRFRANCRKALIMRDTEKALNLGILSN